MNLEKWMLNCMCIKMMAWVWRPPRCEVSFIQIVRSPLHTPPLTLSLSPTHNAYCLLFKTWQLFLSHQTQHSAVRKYAQWSVFGRDYDEWVKSRVENIVDKIWSSLMPHVIIIIIIIMYCNCKNSLSHFLKCVFEALKKKQQFKFHV